VDVPIVLLACIIRLLHPGFREIRRHDNGSDMFVKLVAGLESGRSDPAESTLPLERLESRSVDMGTQTDLIAVH